MGLDSVEFVISIEKAFDIEIPNPVAEQLVTVGAMYDYVWERVRDRTSEQCTSQQLFYRLRAAIIKSTTFAHPIFPSSVLEELIPLRNRKEIWKEIARDIELKIPTLVFSNRLYLFLLWSTVILILAGIVVGFYFHSFGAGSLGVAFACGVSRLLSVAFTPWKTAFRDDTLRNMTTHILRLNPSLYKEKGLTRRDVEAVIDNLIIDKVGVSKDEISPEKSFTYDLGMD